MGIILVLLDNMIEKYGVIWIDGDEVIVQVYEKFPDKWKLFHHSDYDLATFTPERKPSISEIVEVIAASLASSYASHVIDWRIFARNIEEEKLLEISTSTSIEGELLTLQREQDLLSKC